MTMTIRQRIAQKKIKLQKLEKEKINGKIPETGYYGQSTTVQPTTGELAEVGKIKFLDLSEPVRDRFLKRLREDIEIVRERTKFDFSDFGFKSIDDFIELMLKTINATKFLGFEKTIPKRIGQLSVVAGELFERLIINYPKLWLEFRILTVAHIAELNDIKKRHFLIRSSELWKNQTSVERSPIPVKSNFKYVGKATNIRIKTPASKPEEWIEQKWADAAEFAQNKEGLGSFAITVEIKLPGAQKEFRKQIGGKLERFMMPENMDLKKCFVVFEIDGKQKEVSFENFIFIINSMHNIAITAKRKANEWNYSMNFTTLSGYKEFFTIIKEDLGEAVNNVKELSQILYKPEILDILNTK